MAGAQNNACIVEGTPQSFVVLSEKGFKSIGIVDLARLQYIFNYIWQRPPCDPDLLVCRLLLEARQSRDC